MNEVFIYYAIDPVGIKISYYRYLLPFTVIINSDLSAKSTTVSSSQYCGEEKREGGSILKV